MHLDIDVRLLGSLHVHVDGRAVQLGGAKQRTLFTALALRAPEALTVDELIDVLWSGQPPPGGVQSLQKQVSRLRRRLGQGAPVDHRAAGYALAIDRGALDLRRFEDLLGRARIALAHDDAASAAARFEAALALWRGPALADHRFERFAQVEIARLEELRLEAIEERMAAELARGRDADLVGELRALVAEHPMRERLRAHLMLALYRSARQADALEAMREGRRTLVEELGVEPGPELRRLERLILAHDPKLSARLPPRAVPAELPVPADVLIGRERELAEVVDLLMRPGTRLVTLAGAGGVGKTRLALEAARRVGERFAGGVVYVDLDAVDNAQWLVSEAAAALGVVAATPAELAERRSRGGRGAPVLLLLDGFERLPDGVGEVARLLAAVEHVTVLATSQVVLRLSGEHVYLVHPLALPQATALFAARVDAARAGWAPCDDDQAVVAAICARLDGLPLAIELAATRLRLLPLRALLGRLDRRLEILTEGASDRPPRQRSLRATLERSWEVLDAVERRLLCLVTVFEGGVSLEAAEAVCAPALGPRVLGVLASLLDKSVLLRTDAREDEPRFGMPDTTREFVVERAAGVPELAAAELRHARYFLGSCERLAAQAAHGHRRDALSRLAAERANIRLAHERLLRAGEAEGALRVAVGFAKALPSGEPAREVRGWLGASLSAVGCEAPALRATALCWDGSLALSQARFDEAELRLRAALAAALEAREPGIEAEVLVVLGRRATLVTASEALDLAEAALAAARTNGDRRLIADGLLTLAGACERAFAWERAASLVGEALELHRAAGDPHGAADALAALGWNDVVSSGGRRAEAYLHEAVELRRRHGDDRRLVERLLDDGWLGVFDGDCETARQRFRDCLNVAREPDDQLSIGEALAGLSSVAGTQGRWADCAELGGASALVHARSGASPRMPARMLHERAARAARVAIGEAAYERCFADGRAAGVDATLRRTHDASALSADDRPSVAVTA